MVKELPLDSLNNIYYNWNYEKPVSTSEMKKNLKSPDLQDKNLDIYISNKPIVKKDSIIYNLVLMQTN